MRRLFVVICLLLLYGSMYPWQFHFAGITPVAAFARVFHSWPPVFTSDILQDVVLNLVVYIPLGLLGYLAGGSVFSWRRAGWPILAGFLLSLIVETVQSYVPGRVPSGLDLTCNTAGSVAGVILGILYEKVIERIVGRAAAHLRRPSSALMMLIVFAGHMMIPVILYGYEWFTELHRIHDSQRGGRWNLLANALVTWLMAGRFLEAIGTEKRTALRTAAWLLAVLAAVAALRMTVPLSKAELAGAAAGVLVYFVTASLFGTEARDRLLAVAGLAWLIGDGLRPYSFTAHNSFEWIPFQGMLGSDWLNGVISLLNKAWIYGCAFWVWERAGLNRPVCAAALMAVVAAIETAQLYLPGRVSTMTDLAMGALAAGLLWGVERKYGASSLEAP